MDLRRLIISLIIIVVILGISVWWFSQRSQPEMDDSLQYEIMVEGLNVPWALDITKDGRIFFTERGGKIKLLIDGDVHTLKTIDVKSQENIESGLLGLVLSPRFTEDHRIYVYYTYFDSAGSPWNRVSWLNYSDMMLDNETVIIDKIPAGDIHDGGRIKFGPDGKLYITTGETGEGQLAQDLDSLAGKILRYNPLGSIPVDNPFEGSPVYSYGNRNPQGLAWHPETEMLYSTEHGPSGENFWFGHDEINLIKPGRNYGWPEVIGYSDNPNYTDPLYHTGEDTWAPSGATFLHKPGTPWHGRLFVANLRGTSIRMISFSPPNYTTIEVYTPLFEEFGRIRTVVQGPDGYLYFCTSNRDGRGNPSERDDMIIRFNPP
jgi:glucose/arabinose dehydrogenase